MKNTGTLKVTTPSDREIVLTRVFDAPRCLVFDAFSKPEMLRQWFGPRGWSLSVCDVDFKVGGKWRFVLRGPDGTEMGMSGVYREIAPPERSVHTESFDDYPGESVVTTVLVEREGKTTLTATVQYSSKEIRDAVINSGMEHGAAESYDKLAELLTARGAGAMAYVDPGPPRFENGKGMIIAGLNVRYTHTTRINIPAQWERFGPRIGEVPGQVGNVSYGVCWNFDVAGDFDYISGVEVRNASGLPSDLSQVDIPAHRYVVFTHNGHVSGLPKTIEYVWGTWVPKAEYKVAQGPVFERYGECFNPQTGLGDTELWIPIKT